MPSKSNIGDGSVRDLPLHDVMNEVCRQLDRAPVEKPCRPVCDSVAEIDIFIRFDPLLCDLQCQYKNARAHRRRHEKDFGKDDPMADIARDIEDSAWCAMQTRYMEVRADRALMQKVQSAQRSEREAAERKKSNEKRQDALMLFFQTEILSRMRQQAKSPAIFDWLLILWLMKRMSHPFSASPSFALIAA